MNIIQTITTPHQSTRGVHKPQLIVMHIADGTYEGTKAWFQNNASQTSSHFIVAKDGRVCQCVPLDKMAWCNGTATAAGNSKYFGHSSVELVRQLGGNANQYSVSIECEGMYADAAGDLTAAQLEAVAALTIHIRDEVQRLYNHTIPLDRRYIVGHCEITPKTRPHCPGEHFPWSTLMKRLQSPGETTAPSTLYGVVKQVIALGDRTAAERYAADLNAKGEQDAYYYVVERSAG